MTRRDDLLRLHFINALFAGLTGHDLYLAQQIQSAITTSLAEAESRPPSEPGLHRRRRPVARTAAARAPGSRLFSLGRRRILHGRHPPLHPRARAGRPEGPGAIPGIHPAGDQPAAGSLPSEPAVDGAAPARIRRVARPHQEPRRRPHPPQRQDQYFVHIMFVFTEHPASLRRGPPGRGILARFPPPCRAGTPGEASPPARGAPGRGHGCAGRAAP